MMKKNKTTTPEAEVASAALQRPSEVSIGGKTFEVPQATPATLLLVSEKISKLELVTNIENLGDMKENALPMVIQDGKRMKQVAEVLAVIILGAKALRDLKPQESKWYLPSFMKKDKNDYERLVDHIFYNATPAELVMVLSNLINNLEIGFFLDITTFLSNLNLIAPTKKTTPSLP
jgi:hypothetical protein